MDFVGAVWHWVLQVTGVAFDPATGSEWYNFWSGFGSDLGELVIIGALAGWYKRNKCISCWRLSHHDVANTHFRTCHRHFTQADHMRLQKLHERNFPEIHKFMGIVEGLQQESDKHVKPS